MKAATLVAAAALLLPAVPSLAQQVPSEITEANRRFEQAYNRGDAAAVAALYTETATLLPPGADMLQGRPAIQTFWQGAYASGLRSLALSPMSFETYGGAAGREIGRFTAEAPGGQAGQTQRVEGKYVVVWKRTPQGWQLDTDIWNASR